MGQETGLHALFELAAVALKENHFEDLPAARKERGIFGKVVEERGFEEEMGEDFT